MTLVSSFTVAERAADEYVLGEYSLSAPTYDPDISIGKNQFSDGIRQFEYLDPADNNKLFIGYYKVHIPGIIAAANGYETEYRESCSFRIGKTPEREEEKLSRDK